MGRHIACSTCVVIPNGFAVLYGTRPEIRHGFSSGRNLSLLAVQGVKEPPGRVYCRHFRTTVAAIAIKATINNDKLDGSGAWTALSPTTGISTVLVKP